MLRFVRGWVGPSVKVESRKEGIVVGWARVRCCWIDEGEGTIVGNIIDDIPVPFKDAFAAAEPACGAKRKESLDGLVREPDISGRLVESSSPKESFLEPPN